MRNTRTKFIFAIAIMAMSVSAATATTPPRKAHVSTAKPTGITAADIKAAPALFELTVRGGKMVDSCDNEAFGPERKDLNKDGHSPGQPASDALSKTMDAMPKHSQAFTSSRSLAS